EGRLEDDAASIAVRQASRDGRAEEHPHEAGTGHQTDLRRSERELLRDRRDEESDEQDVHRVEHPAESARNEQPGVKAIERHAVESCDERLRAHAPRQPSAARSSAFRTDAPAAPRIVLCPSTTNFTPRTGSSRTRPTTTDMPLPVSRSRIGCGLSRSARTTTGRSGAVGSFSSCGRPRNRDIDSVTSATDGAPRKVTLTLSVCPSRTLTRLHDAETAKVAGAKCAPSHSPRNFCVSLSTFSSSPPMYGTTLSSASSEGTPG